MTFSEKPVPQPHDLKETTESTADSPSGDYGFSIYTREPKAFSFYDWQKISMEKGKTAEEWVEVQQVTETSKPRILIG